MKHISLISMFPIAVLTCTTLSWADDGDADSNESSKDESTDERTGRKMDLRVDDAGPPAPRHAYVHDGFYFRVGAGPGFMQSSIVDRRLDDSAGSAAFSFAADAMIGGSPAPGLALGVGALAHLGLGAKFDGTGAGGIFHLNVGPFFDAFPNSKKGFHLGALVGGSTVSLSSAISPQTQLWGGGAAAFLGWDSWIAPEWSVGVQLQSGGSYVTASDVGASIFHLNLMVTLLDH